jgi:hypothetical protein
MFENESCFINVIVRTDVFTRSRKVLRESPPVIVRGKVQQRHGVTNLLAGHITSLV